MELGDQLIVTVNGTTYPLIVSEILSPSRVKAGDYYISIQNGIWQVENYIYPHSIQINPILGLVGVPEIDWQILLSFPPEEYRSLLAFCSTSPRASSICDNEEFWKTKIDQDFGVSQLKPSEISYRDQYITLNTLGVNDAALQGRIDALQLAIKRGLLNQRNASFAAVQGRVDLLEGFSRVGILPGLAGANAAAGRGHLRTLQWLEEHGILPNQDGVRVAESNGHGSTVRWLNSRGIYSD